MDLDKVILYYAFTPVNDPQALMLWQKTLCQSLNIKGRILISPHGINGTLGGIIKFSSIPIIFRAKLLQLLLSKLYSSFDLGLFV